MTTVRIGSAPALRLGALWILLLLSFNAAAARAQAGAGNAKGTPTAKRANVTLPLSFRRTYTNAEVEAALRALAARYPRFTRLLRIGESFEGRPIFALTIWNPDTGPIEHKAAIYIDGNMHGNEVQGTEVCLYIAQVLLRDRERDPLVHRVFDERVVHLVPIVNPDGRAHFLREPNTPHTSRHNRRPWDDDGDGLVDEDGPNDIDGDGMILMMRVRDPYGDWVVGDDPRLMRRRRPDEPGMFRVWWTEGLDDDGDGRFNEDGPGGVDLNRNFPSAWQPRGTQWGAGDYPLSEPETRAIARFILAHPQIAAIQSYHNFGNMILRPPGAMSDEAAKVPARDRRLYDALAARGRALLPGYRYLQTFKGLYPVRGGFLDWGYLGLGVITFTNELWNMPADYDGNGRVSERERLRWSDENLEGRGFIDWHKAPHPQLGEVELGGWHPMARRIPPGWQLEDVCARNCRFTLVHADQMPRVAIGAVHVERLERNLVRLEVECANRAAIDTRTAMEERLGAVGPDRVTIRAPSTNRLRVLWAGVASGPKPAPFEAVERNPQAVRLATIPGHSVRRVAWLLEAKLGTTVEIRLRSVRGGLAVRRVALDAEGERR